jgi:hypothetical protein
MTDYTDIDLQIRMLTTRAPTCPGAPAGVVRPGRTRRGSATVSASRRGVAYFGTANPNTGLGTHEPS